MLWSIIISPGFIMKNSAVPPAVPLEPEDPFVTLAILLSSSISKVYPFAVLVLNNVCSVFPLL